MVAFSCPPPPRLHTYTYAILGIVPLNIKALLLTEDTSICSIPYGICGHRNARRV